MTLMKIAGMKEAEWLLADDNFKFTDERMLEAMLCAVSNTRDTRGLLLNTACIDLGLKAFMIEAIIRFLPEFGYRVVPVDAVPGDEA